VLLPLPEELGVSDVVGVGVVVTEPESVVLKDDVMESDRVASSDELVETVFDLLTSCVSELVLDDDDDTLNDVDSVVVFEVSRVALRVTLEELVLERDSVTLCDDVVESLMEVSAEGDGVGESDGDADGLADTDSEDDPVTESLTDCSDVGVSLRRLGDKGTLDDAESVTEGVLVVDGVTLSEGLAEGLGLADTSGDMDVVRE
jgi:hypothetical protein